MSTSVWPYDYLKEQHDIYRENPDQLNVFLISPFNPAYRYDELFTTCKYICEQIGKNRAANIICHRGDSPSTPNVIHQDIWNFIKKSDVVIADISERNSNVMIELGVAMAIRDKNSVIIIQDAESESTPLFDISPARYIKYRRSIGGDHEFVNQLIKALEFSLGPAPYIPDNFTPIELPLEINNFNSNYSEILLGPSNMHKRIIDGGLEFGSLLYFQYSWLTVGENKYSNIRFKTKMRFSELAPGDDTPKNRWIGIMLRSQHFFANYGHLIYVREDGDIIYAKPLTDMGKHEDETLGSLNNFDFNNWINFDFMFDEKNLNITINNSEFRLPVIDMPYCYNSGLIRLQTYRARACINYLNISDL